MIIIAFDFGTKNIGVAVGQTYTNTAHSLPSIKTKNNQEQFKKIFNEWQPNIVVVGNPLNINGTKQTITKKSEMFSQTLKKIFNIPVLLHDERLSTVEAKSILFEKYGYKSLTKNRVDSMAAVIILESWLSYSHDKVLS
ncbi:MAG: Holliday junction resolvase RuvX [Buchnera aphidicola (Chaetogeoica yunlongensis)]